MENEENGSNYDDEDPEYDAEIESETDSDESDIGSFYIDNDCDEELKT